MTLRSLRFLALLPALVLTEIAVPVQAGPIVDAATAIEGKLVKDDAAGALSAAGDLYAQVWDQTRALGFTQALLVAENATGYGVYNPRPTNLFKKGEPILIYCEPYGFDYGNPGEGLWSVNLFVDLQVLDASGNQLANAPDATEYNMTSRHQNREVQANITYTLDGIQPGRYTLVTTLRDKNSQKLGSFQTAIEITQ
ncbi:MAG: hypothetical protein ACOH2H_16910 [Cypionkella sp.]